MLYSAFGTDDYTQKWNLAKSSVELFKLFFFFFGTSCPMEILLKSLFVAAGILNYWLSKMCVNNLAGADTESY